MITTTFDIQWSLPQSISKHGHSFVSAKLGMAVQLDTIVSRLQRDFAMFAHVIQ